MSSKRSTSPRPSPDTAPDTESQASDTKAVGRSLPARQETTTGATQRTIRETIESIVVAFVLAFLFRTFEAEAFVIPTGSMAPTLQGRHKDLICSKCGTHYRVSASLSEELDEDPNEPKLSEAERIDRARKRAARLKSMEVTEGTCPNCRYTMNVDPDTVEGQQWPAYNGDRILVAKFPYDFADPKRWDVIVFRYPRNAQMNFIKRLVGLPRETLRIEQGDIYVQPEGAEQFEIVHKPAEKVWAMAQDVYDNDYVVDWMSQAGWPLRWQPIGSEKAAWTSPDSGRSYETAGGSGEAWIRYQHFIPSQNDWREMQARGRVPYPPRPHLITDFYAYDTGEQRGAASGDPPMGLHWVGDLTLEATLEVRKDEGSVVFELVKGGRHFQCELNVQTGEATLTIDGLTDFRPTTQTSAGGAGRHRVAFANVDRQLLLWIDDELVTFPVPTVYGDLDNALPTADDLAPAGVASRGADLKIEHLVLNRDIYYIAKKAGVDRYDAMSDYDFPASTWSQDQFANFFSSPDRWTRDGLFSWRRSVEFQLEADQFFALGDNSPQSKDSRLWAEGSSEFYVRRELLIGQALFIYWPASHNRIPYVNIPFPLFPNFKDMGFIR